MIEEICTHPWKHRVEPFRIAGNLYYVGNANVSCHLIDTGDGLVLLDSAFPQTVYLLLESIRRLGFDPRDLRLIVHTHAHYDHFGGTRAIVELTGAKTALGKDDVFVLAERPELSWAAEYGVPFYETFEVDRPLSDGDRIVQGGLEIECVHTPGHTPGCMSFLFPVIENGKEYLAGIHGGPGLNTLSAGYRAKYGLSMAAREDFLASLRKLRERRVAIHLAAHPGQNDTLGKGARGTAHGNPFIDETSWPRFLEKLELKAVEEFKKG